MDTRVLFAKIGIQGLHGVGFIVTLHLTKLIVRHSQDSFQIEAFFHEIKIHLDTVQ